jgi:uncharacterized delta-60 repeat protein
MRGRWAGITVAAVVSAAVALAGVAFGARAGTLDHSFAGDGKTKIGDLTGYAQTVEVGRHKRIVAAGFGGNQFGPGDSFAVARLRANGKPDRSFSHDGIKETDFGSMAAANDIALTHRGGIVAAGLTCKDRNTCDAAVVRYQRDGDVKRSFGHKGRVRLNFGPGSDVAYAVGFGSLHRILVAGANCPPGSPGCNIAIARLEPNGTLDRSFGTGAPRTGMVVTQFGPPSDQCGGAADMSVVDVKGRFLVAGSCAHGEVDVALFRPDGSLQRPDFGDNGVARADVGFKYATAMDLASGGGIVVGGDRGREGFGVVRFTRRGKLDRSFGSNGVASTKVRGPSRDLAVDSKGRIVLAGGSGSAFAFARFRPNGKLDRSFANDGRKVVDGDWGFGYALGVTTDRRDRIVGSGFKQRRFALVRLNG